jgi:hypothetical protein
MCSDLPAIAEQEDEDDARDEPTDVRPESDASG